MKIHQGDRGSPRDRLFQDRRVIDLDFDLLLKSYILTESRKLLLDSKCFWKIIRTKV